MNIVTMLFTGTHPMLQHNPAGMARTEDSKLDTKRIPTAQAEAMAGRYLSDDGYFRFPAQGFKSSIVSGGVGRRIGKRSAKAVLQAAIFPAEEWVPLLDPKTGKPLKGDKYEVDIRRAVIKKVNGILRARPKVSPWACRVAFEVDEIIEKPELLKEIGNLAGRMVGVGDFRPEKGGPFGRYTVELV